MDELGQVSRSADPAAIGAAELLPIDRGVQYASAQYRALLAAADIQPGMSRPANPYDNAAMESFMATYKRECVALSAGYATHAQATEDFFAYVEIYYNRHRSHSALGYQSPVDFENQLN
jgi:transposase InsO family protein